MRVLSVLLVCLLMAGCLCSCPVEQGRSSALKESGFVHIVFFWLKEDASVAQKQQLMDDCKTYLGAIETVRDLEVGVPAGTQRDVVDNSYGVSLVVHFDNRADQDFYQKAQKHIEFIERNQDIWTRVQVYDMVK